MADSKTLQIRNSTIDFLTFTRQSGEESIEVRVQDNDVWLTQASIAKLFGVDRSVITKHLKTVFEDGEIVEASTCANFTQVADNGKTYNYKFYGLKAVIAVGYKVNSQAAVEFRQWATRILETFAKQGYVLDKQRLENGQIFDEAYFDHLVSEIQEIRASERKFYQKITDIYATAYDYSPESKTTKDFFSTVQNKMHYAVHGNTAAEVIIDRANHTKPNMGLTSWKNAPNGKIVKADVSIAKNYLYKQELEELNELDKLEEIVNNQLTVHVVEKKIRHIDENGDLITPTEPNGYKFELLVLDMIHMMDNNLAYEVAREKEFAPIKNLHGTDSVDSARELLEKNGIKL